MRTINEIIIHCSATREGQAFTAKDIDRWHCEKGYRMIGYHYVILIDGTIESGRPLEQAGVHCQGHNAHSIGICYIGGLDNSGHPSDTRTPQQHRAMKQLINKLLQRFPNATVHGHCEFANKDCPCFEVSSPDEQNNPAVETRHRHVSTPTKHNNKSKRKNNNETNVYMRNNINDLVPQH